MERMDITKKLYDWAGEDREHRSVMILSNEDGDTHCAYQGDKYALLKAVMDAICDDSYLREVFTVALETFNEIDEFCKKNKQEQEYDKARIEGIEGDRACSPQAPK